MEKKIEITFDDNETQMIVTSKGLNRYEIVGILNLTLKSYENDELKNFKPRPDDLKVNNCGECPFKR